MIPSTRRTSGALACLLTLHLSVIAGDLGCARHPSGPSREAPASLADAAPQPAGAAPHAAPHAAHHEHGASAAEPDGEQPRESCRTPSRADCCEAMASCQVQIAFAETAELVVTSDRGATMRGSELAPDSSPISPDIPPPKA